MNIKSAEFIKSSNEIALCPAPDKPEYAFVGRSNVGKSSLINAITSYKKLAKTSSSPGLTRLINHFLINNSWYLVDLPGYGYVKTSKAFKQQFSILLSNYLKNRENLHCLFVLIDSRHHPLKNDLEFIEWLGINKIPFLICFTKTDKLTSSELLSNTSYYKKKLSKTWDPLPEFITVSSKNMTGINDILIFIEKTNKLYTKKNSY